MSKAVRSLRAAVQRIVAEFDDAREHDRVSDKGRCDNWFKVGPCGRDEPQGGRCIPCWLDRVEDALRRALEKSDT